MCRLVVLAMGVRTEKSSQVSGLGSRVSEAAIQRSGKYWMRVRCVGGRSTSSSWVTGLEGLGPSCAAAGHWGQSPGVRSGLKA